jgi:hypothetical protein
MVVHLLLNSVTGEEGDDVSTCVWYMYEVEVGIAWSGQSQLSRKAGNIQDVRIGCPQWY